LLSHLDASLEVAGLVVALGTNFWGSGKVEPTGFKLLRSLRLSRFRFLENWQLSRQLVMPYGLGERKGTTSKTQFCNRILIQYIKAVMLPF